MKTKGISGLIIGLLLITTVLAQDYWLEEFE